MGDLFFGVDIQAEMADAITPDDVPNFTLRKRPQNAPNSTLSGAGTAATPVDYNVHGTITKYTVDEMRDLPGVVKGDKRVMIIAKPLADVGVEPSPNDEILIGSKTWRIVSVDTDAAVAKYVCQVRGR